MRNGAARFQDTPHFESPPVPLFMPRVVALAEAALAELHNKQAGIGRALDELTAGAGTAEATQAVLAKATALFQGTDAVHLVSLAAEQAAKLCLLRAQSAAAEEEARGVADEVGAFTCALAATKDAADALAAAEARGLKRKRDALRADDAQRAVGLVGRLPGAESGWVKELLIEIAAQLLRVDAASLYQLRPAAVAPVAAEADGIVA